MEPILKQTFVPSSWDVYPVLGKCPDEKTTTTWHFVQNQNTAKKIVETLEKNGKDKTSISTKRQLQLVKPPFYICLELQKETGLMRVLYMVKLKSYKYAKRRRFLIYFPAGDKLAADVLHEQNEDCIRRGVVTREENILDVTPENILIDGLGDFNAVCADRYFGAKISRNDIQLLSVEKKMSIGENKDAYLLKRSNLAEKHRIMELVSGKNEGKEETWLVKHGNNYTLRVGTKEKPDNRDFALTTEEQAVICNAVSSITHD